MKTESNQFFVPHIFFSAVLSQCFCKKIPTYFLGKDSISDRHITDFLVYTYPASSAPETSLQDWNVYFEVTLAAVLISG